MNNIMASLQPVSVTRLYRMIANQIAGKIRAGEFIRGGRLPSERELAEKLQVSRTSVREALIALELEGYVEVRVGAGVFVVAAIDDADDADDEVLIAPHGEISPFELIGVHLLVEPECAALAAKHATEAQRAAIEASGRAMEGSDMPTTHNRAFHIAIAEASGNAALAMTVTNLWNYRDSSALYDKLEQHLATPQVWHVAEAEHDCIIQSILARNPVAARRAMRTHFLEIRRRLREDFKRG
jgi:DNA-binding FadR family transcriptional regulator